jgi:hypothetical protein
MKPETWPSVARTVACIAAITIVTTAALIKGHDGWVVTLALSALSGIGGFSVRPLLDKLRGRPDSLPL